jgi:hypothetical protein
MTDAQRLELLLDCDRYLERQQALLDRLAANGSATAEFLAMDAALDQLAQAVAMGWRNVVAGDTLRHSDEEIA